ncbi:unnamed protein product [Brassica napus]|nr:unnamed protein product [Brassica napus]
MTISLLPTVRVVQYNVTHRFRTRKNRRSTAIVYRSETVKMSFHASTRIRTDIMTMTLTSIRAVSLRVCEICHSDARNVTGANEMVEEEEEEEEVEVVVEVEEEGVAAVGEDGESWWQRRMLLIFVITCWVSPFSIYFLVIQN